MTDKRKPGQSQLDYLWTNFGNISIKNEVSPDSSNEVLLTESAIVDYIKKNKEDVNISIDSKIEEGKVVLFIKDKQGTIISKTSFDQDYVSIITEDNGIYLQTQNNKIPILKGQSSNSIKTTIKNNKIVNELKIDNPITKKSVDIIETDTGIKAELVIDNNSNIIINKTDNGINCHFKWLDETKEDVNFQTLSFSNYSQILEPDNGTVYFIYDIPCIYFRKIKYGSTESLKYLEENYYSKSEIDKLIPEPSSTEDLIEKVNKLF